jgi:hypothetical protein
MLPIFLGLRPGVEVAACISNDAPTRPDARLTKNLPSNCPVPVKTAFAVAPYP